MTTRTLIEADAIALMQTNPRWTAARAVAWVSRYNETYLAYLNHLSREAEAALIQSIERKAKQEVRTGK